MNGIKYSLRISTLVCLTCHRPRSSFELDTGPVAATLAVAFRCCDLAAKKVNVDGDWMSWRHHVGNVVYDSDS